MFGSSPILLEKRVRGFKRSRVQGYILRQFYDIFECPLHFMHYPSLEPLNPRPLGPF